MEADTQVSFMTSKGFAKDKKFAKINSALVAMVNNFNLGGGWG